MFVLSGSYKGSVEVRPAFNLTSISFFFLIVCMNFNIYPVFLCNLQRYSTTTIFWSKFDKLSCFQYFNVWFINNDASNFLPFFFFIFHRLCAVFGGIYHLKKGAEALVISDSDNSCKGIVSEDQIFLAPHVVLGVSSFPKSFLVNPEKKGLSRGIFITDR